MDAKEENHDKSIDNSSLARSKNTFKLPSIAEQKNFGDSTIFSIQEFSISKVLPPSKIQSMSTACQSLIGLIMGPNI